MLDSAAARTARSRADHQHRADQHRGVEAAHVDRHARIRRTRRRGRAPGPRQVRRSRRSARRAATSRPRPRVACRPGDAEQRNADVQRPRSSGSRRRSTHRDSAAHAMHRPTSAASRGRRDCSALIRHQHERRQRRRRDQAEMAGAARDQHRRPGEGDQPGQPRLRARRGRDRDAPARRSRARSGSTWSENTRLNAATTPNGEISGSARRLRKTV